MKNKINRLEKIVEIINRTQVGSQEDLLKLLQDKGCALTQATLSRDLKQLKVVKMPVEHGGYRYILPEAAAKPAKKPTVEGGFVSVDFSGNLVVIKTRPGYAAGIASDIDSLEWRDILGTIAGDDTILLIARENISRQDILKTLSTIIPSILS